MPPYTCKIYAHAGAHTRNHMQPHATTHKHSHTHSPPTHTYTLPRKKRQTQLPQTPSSPVRLHVRRLRFEDNELVRRVGRGVLDAVQEGVVVGLPRDRRRRVRLEGRQRQDGRVAHPHAHLRVLRLVVAVHVWKGLGVKAILRRLRTLFGVALLGGKISRMTFMHSATLHKLVTKDEYK